MPSVVGSFQPHPRGFGFVDLDTPLTLSGDRGEVEVTSLFVAPDQARGWLAGDRVSTTATLDDQDRANAGELALVSRSRQFVVGTVRVFAGKVVLALDPRLGAGTIETSSSLAEKVVRAESQQVVAVAAPGPDGRPVAAALVAGPTPAKAPIALRARAVVMALGGAAPDGIPGGPAAVGLDPAETRGLAMRALGHLAGGRAGLSAGLSAEEGPVPGVDLPLDDLRDEICVTIDADTTRDLDDALGAVWSGDAGDDVELSIYIADAAGTIGLGSAADRYAATMATSAYFTAGENAPMLDPALSEGELSLLPGVARRAVTVRVRVGPDGALSAPAISTAWIEVAARLSYAAVDGYLADRDAHHLTAGAHGPSGAAVAVLAPVAATVDALAEASRRLGAERDGRDTLESLFEPEELEAAVVDGKIRAVAADPHPVAQRVVERLMVAANELVATWAVEQGLPLLYRSHLGFDPERLGPVLAAAEALGVALEAADGVAIEASDVVRVVEDLQDAGRSEDAAMLVTAAAGAVARATYDADPSHHRGLGAAAYTHFTSPIRRYADLVVHRQVRAHLAGEPLPYDVEQLGALAAWLDARAGAADFAQKLERASLWSVLLERGAVSWPTEAVVTGITANGLRVRMPVPGLSGFVSAARALGEAPKARPALQPAPDGLATVDGRFRLGMRLKVALDRIDDLGRPDLKLA